MVIWLATLPALATPVGCDVATSREDFDYLLLRADQAIAMLDPEELGEATDVARAEVKCVEYELDRVQIARLYRLSGIARYVNEDLVNAVSDFGIARDLDPNGEIDAALGKPLRMTYDAVPPSTGATLDLPRPEEGYLRVDGEIAESAAADRGYFLQWIKDDELVHGTWLVAKGEIPPYPQKGAGKDKGAKGDGGHGLRNALLATGLATGVAGVGGMVTAQVLQDRFDRSDNPSDLLIDLNRGFGYGGIVAGSVGAALVGTSIVLSF